MKAMNEWTESESNSIKQRHANEMKHQCGSIINNCFFNRSPSSVSQSNEFQFDFIDRLDED